MDKILIINELKKHYNIKNNAEFARFLGITTQNMYTWVKRNTYDVGAILAKCPDINAEWLLTGEGEMLKASAPQALEANNPNIVAMPIEVWDVIKSQADSLKAKDGQMDMVLESLKAKDAQTSEVIAVLKEQLKKGQFAQHQGYAADSGMVVVEVEG